MNELYLPWESRPSFPHIPFVFGPLFFLARVKFSAGRLAPFPRLNDLPFSRSVWTPASGCSLLGILPILSLSVTLILRAVSPVFYLPWLFFGHSTRPHCLVRRCPPKNKLLLARFSNLTAANPPPCFFFALSFERFFLPNPCGLVSRPHLF